MKFYRFTGKDRQTTGINKSREIFLKQLFFFINVAYCRSRVYSSFEVLQLIFSNLEKKYIYICCVILLAPLITTKHQPYISRFITHQKKRFSNVRYWQCVKLWLKLSSQFRNSKNPASRGRLSYLQVLYMKILLFGETRQLKSRTLNKTYPRISS